MITKQQALEFIYELSQKYQVCIDTKKGFIGLNPFVYDDDRDDNYLELGYEYSSQTNENDFEGIVTQFIKDNLHTDLLEYVNFPISVDVDMLEVGQTYKVHIQEDWDHRYFTAKFLGFDEDNVVKFENQKPCTKFDFREIYKVNE